MTAITAGTSTFTISGSGATYSLASGLTRGGLGAYQGVVIDGNNDVVTNSGTMIGGTQVGTGYFGGIAVYGHGVSVTNEYGGYLHGANVNEAGIVFAYFGTIVNAGRIVSFGGPPGDAADGIDLFRGGIVTNLSTGTISGNGIFVGTYAATPSTIVNSGVILGGNVYGGIYLGEGGVITNLAHGTISANGLAYGIDVVNAAGTITNAGTIDGGVTLASNAANLVVVDPGAAFSGPVLGGGGELELAYVSGASTGTLNATGANFTNFSSLVLDSGSGWLIQGGASLASEFSSIDGFAATDTIQLTGHDTIASQSSSGGTTHVTLTGASPMVLNFQGSPDLQASFGGGITTLTEVAAPVVTISLVDDTSHGSLDTSNDELQGTGADSTTVTFKENGSTIGSTTSDGNGNWTFTPSGLSQGSNTITDSETTSGGPGSASLTFTYDTVAPAVTISLVDDSGASSSDGITNNDELQGGGDPNATVTFKENGSTIGSTAANGAGTWSFNPVGIGQGSNTITAYETDTAGNTGSASVTFTLDTTATFDAQVYTDANGDGTQDNGETGLAGVTVNLLDGSGNPTGTTGLTDSSGNVSFTGLAPGSYRIQFSPYCESPARTAATSSPASPPAGTPSDSPPAAATPPTPRSGTATRTCLRRPRRSASGPACRSGSRRLRCG